MREDVIDQKRLFIQVPHHEYNCNASVGIVVVLYLEDDIDPGHRGCNIIDPGYRGCNIIDPGYRGCNIIDPGYRGCNIIDPGYRGCRVEMYVSRNENRHKKLNRNVFEYSCVCKGGGHMHRSAVK